MIYVSKDQYKQIEYFISQSLQGFHPLFDRSTLISVLSNSAPINSAEAYAVEPLIERLISLPSFEEKRSYLASLDSPTYQAVLKTYFTIVENNLFESQKTLH